MKQFSALFLLLICLDLFAQKSEQAVPVLVGLYAPYATQPGIRVGTSFNLTDWEGTKLDAVKSRNLFISPQLAVFNRLSNHTSYLLNTDVGYHRASSKRKLYAAYSLGLGYLMENQTLSSTVDLSTGNITNKDKELRGYFLPTANFEFGKEPRKKIGWYTKFSLGRKVSSQVENSGFFALEFGARMLLNKATDTPKKASN